MKVPIKLKTHFKQQSFRRLLVPRGSPTLIRGDLNQQEDLASLFVLPCGDKQLWLLSLGLFSPESLEKVVDFKPSSKTTVKKGLSMV